MPRSATPAAAISQHRSRRIKCQHDLGADKNHAEGDCDSRKEDDLSHGDLPSSTIGICHDRRSQSVLCITSRRQVRAPSVVGLFLCRADARNKKIATSDRRRRRRKRRPERQANELFIALCLFHSGSLGRGEPICARQSQLHCGGNLPCSPTKAPPPRWRGFPFGRFTGEPRALNCIDGLSDGESRSASSSALGLAGFPLAPLIDAQIAKDN